LILEPKQKAAKNNKEKRQAKKKAYDARMILRITLVHLNIFSFNKQESQMTILTPYRVRPQMINPARIHINPPLFSSATTTTAAAAATTTTTTGWSFEEAEEGT
jgi:hypothetical protein